LVSPSDSSSLLLAESLSCTKLGLVEIEASLCLALFIPLVSGGCLRESAFLLDIMEFRFALEVESSRIQALAHSVQKIICRFCDRRPTRS
jgi:hypothetical protein